MFNRFKAILHILIPVYAITFDTALRILLLSILDVFRILLKRFTLLAEACKKIQRKFLRNFLVKAEGLYFVVPDYFSLKIIFLEYSEPYIYSFFKRTLRKGYYFLDIGAHVGSYALRAAKLVGPNGVVVAIEPHPQNAFLLKINAKLNNFNNIKIVQAAAWSKRDKLPLYLGLESGWHSLKSEKYRSNFLEVLCLPVDEIVKELGLSRIDLVKIDVEGAEIEVLDGLKNTLVKLKPSVIIEVHSYSNLRKILEMVEDLRKLGIVMLKLDERHYLLTFARKVEHPCEK